MDLTQTTFVPGTIFHSFAAIAAGRSAEPTSSLYDVPSPTYWCQRTANSPGISNGFAAPGSTLVQQRAPHPPKITTARCCAPSPPRTNPSKHAKRALHQAAYPCVAFNPEMSAGGQTQQLNNKPGLRRQRLMSWL